jgi:3-methyladenine DNA glycosylase AlkC
MAEPLIAQYGPDVPAAIARMVQAVAPRFDAAAFLSDALRGYNDLALMPRGRHIAQALRAHLPPAYEEALPIVLAASAQPHGRDPALSLASFIHLPFTEFVAQCGLDHVALSLQALHSLTQRFTAEFAIRPFLMRHPETTLHTLRLWTEDPSEHVRRLVSEGTRPRLPWAPRLPAFQRDPSAGLALVERLKDDPALYVRRSVANHLNDIGKDHPDVLNATAQRWLQGQVSPERRWIVQHALRSSVKRADAAALATLGFAKAEGLAVTDVSITPARPRLGERLHIAFAVHNSSPREQAVMVDVVVHYVKASGKTSAKVFKISQLHLPAGQTQRVGKHISLADMTTRKHHSGTHSVEALINGEKQALGVFELL